MKRILLILLVMLLSTALFCCQTSYADDAVGKGELITLERAVQIGLKKHPSVLAGAGTVQVSEAKEGQAYSGFFPQVDASAGYSRTKSGLSQSSGTGGAAVGTSHSFEQYSTGITAKQMLFDFGKTRTNVSIQKQNLEASKSDLVNTQEQVILNVKQAYYNLLRAKRNLIVAAETVKQFQQHLGQAKAFYEVGTKPKFDVTKAEVDLSNAKLGLIKAENAVRIAMVSLNNAMGLPDAPEYAVEDNLSFVKFEIGPDEAIKKAYDGRPELKALAARRIAAEKAVSAAKTGYFPILTGNASLSWAGENPDVNDSSWSAGISLSIPIFSGFLTKNQISEAKANLIVLTANEEALRQNVLLEVKQTYLSLNEAEELIVTAELAVRQATENHEIATGRYAAGVGNPIEVTDAEVGLSNARAAHIQALYDYKVAAASLEKAMGVR